MGADVLRGAHRQRGAVEGRVQPGDERSLARCETGLHRDVVEEEQKPRHAGVAQRLQLAQQGRAVGFRFVFDVETGRERESESHAEGRAVCGELAEPLELRLVVVDAPLGPMPGVVLGCVRVGVHPARREERHHLEARVVLPRRSVESLDDAAHGERAQHEHDTIGAAYAPIHERSARCSGGPRATGARQGRGRRRRERRCNCVDDHFR